MISGFDLFDCLAIDAGSDLVQPLTLLGKENVYNEYISILFRGLVVCGNNRGASAATLNVALKTADGAQVYQLTSGNYLGLWGIEDGSYSLDNSPNSTSDLIDTFTTGSSSIVGLRYAVPPNSGSWEGNPAAFSQFGTTFQVDDSNGSNQLTDSFWVEWIGGTIGWSGFNGQSGQDETYSMAAIATLDGDPLSAVPLPASVLMLLSFWLPWTPSVSLIHWRASHLARATCGTDPD